MPPNNGKAVFLDRDGTINVEVGYLSRPEQLELIPGSAEALVLLRDAGFKLVVVSNQSGAARGYFTEADVDLVNKKLVSMLGHKGARLDAIYYCPHIKENGCSCRKPLLGMIERAKAEFGIDPSRSYIVGDKAVDVKLAKNAGAVSIMALTGYGAEERPSMHGADAPDHTVANLLDAARLIVDLERDR